MSTTDRNELARLVAEAAANVPASDAARAKLAQRHGATPEQMRALIRPLALWMIEHGVEHVSLTREPGAATSRVLLSIDGKPL